MRKFCRKRRKEGKCYGSKGEKNKRRTDTKQKTDEKENHEIFAVVYFCIPGVLVPDNQ